MQSASLRRFCLWTLACLTGVASAQAGVLETVKQKGFVQCGVSQGLPGFSSADDRGRWTGLDVDFCRAVAAAIFGDAGKVKFTPLSTKERFTALQTGEIDVLSRNSTWTLSRDTALGLTFAGVLYYDGQGFLTHKKLNVKSSLELSGATFCTQTGTTTELNLADYFGAHGLKYEVVTFEKADEAIRAYQAMRCDAFTSDMSQLYSERLKLAAADDHVILNELISKEPLGPMVRQGDDAWFKVIRWTLFALIDAEELGVNSENVDAMFNSPKPEARRLLGAEGNFGEKLGLDRRWARNIIKLVGNYGQIYDRNVGKNSPLKIKRGANRLWNRGGILYAPPIR
jgi:general L-amino acid transport system substrate-binding protein